MLGELVSVLRRYGELDIDEDTAKLLAEYVRGHHRSPVGPGA